MRIVILFLLLIASCGSVKQRKPRTCRVSTGVRTLNDSTVLSTIIFDNGDTLQYATVCDPKQLHAVYNMSLLGINYAHLNWRAQKEYHEIQDTVKTRSYVYYETGRAVH